MSTCLNVWYLTNCYGAKAIVLAFNKYRSSLKEFHSGGYPEVSMSMLRHSNLHSDVRYKNKRLPGARYIAISPNSAADIEPTETGAKLG